MGRLAGVLPVLILAYPVLVWPLVYAEPVEDATGLSAPRTEVGNYLLNKIYFPPLLLWGLTSLLILRRPVHRLMLLFLSVLGIFLGFCAVSALWSLAPDITVRRAALQVVIFGTILCAVLSVRRPYDLFNPIFWLMVLTQMVNLIAVIAWPAGPIGHEGIYTHKNSLGNTAVLAIIVSLYTFARGSGRVRVAALAAIIVGFFLLYQSRSKTATALVLLAPIVGLFLYFTCRICRVPLAFALMGTGLATALGFLAVGQTIDIQLDDVLLWLFDDTTFTGRTHIWQFTLDQIQQRPWLGYGFAGFWDIGPQSPKFGAPDFIAKMPHAHNGYLDLILEIGVIGFALFVVFLVVSLNCIGRVTGDAKAFLFFATLASYVLLTNLMETDLFNPFSASSMLFLLASAAACAHSGKLAGRSTRPSSTGPRSEVR